MVKNRKNIIKGRTSVAAALLFSVLTACSIDESQPAVQPQEDASKISQISEGALPGQLLVRFDPSVSEILEREGLTKSGIGAPAARSGVLSVDEILDIVDGYEIERVFPVDVRSEETARHEGLHLWYVVRFGQEHQVEKVASDLAALGEVSRVEFNRELKRANTAKAKPLTASMLKQLAATRSGEVQEDPLLKYQWHLVNKGAQQELPIDSEYIPEAPKATFMTGADVGMGQVWAKAEENPAIKGNPSIIVAVLDEGVCFTHPDLAASMWVNEGEELRSREDADGNGYKGDRHGYNFVQNTGVISTDSAYDTGHGSHVAGVIAAVNNNGIGIGSIAGGTDTEPGVKIMSCQIFSGAYAGTLLDEVRAIKYAADNGAVVLQCSWGYISGAANPYEWTPQFSTDEEWEESNVLEKKALDYFIHHAGSPDGVIDGGIAVFAAGNEYAPAASYPAAYPDYVSVAATAPDFTPGVYSNYGTGVTISAPGGDQDYYYEYGTGHDMGLVGCVLSTIPDNAALEFDGQLGAMAGGGSYAYMEGTSMACPHVSGVVALGLSYAANLRKHFKAEDVIRMLYDSASDIESNWNMDDPYKYYYKYVADLGQNHYKRLELNEYKGKMGHGQVNAYEFIKAIEGSDAGSDMRFPNVFVSSGAAKNYDLTLYMETGNGFSGSSEDDSVAKVDVDGNKVVVTGHKAGQTKATVSNGNVTHEFVITVRNAAGNNGWL